MSLDSEIRYWQYFQGVQVILEQLYRYTWVNCGLALQMGLFEDFDYTEFLVELIDRYPEIQGYDYPEYQRSGRNNSIDTNEPVSDTLKGLVRSIIKVLE